MREETLKSSVIPSTSPSEAYASDLLRLKRDGPLGSSDDCWLCLAHALQRFSDLSDDDLAVTVPLVADTLAVGALMSGFDEETPLLRCARALRALGDQTVMPSGNDAITELFVATQSVAESQELAGASGLAYATLTGLLRAFGERAVPRSVGNVLSQAGRAARQLGALDLALEMYESAITLGYEADALDVVARALLGSGVLAMNRGNYPKAREEFERALVNAERSNDPELIRSSHHGLMTYSILSGDFESAMVHGWNVLRLCLAPESRAEALMNMAEICRLTGEHDAALRVYAVAMEWTTNVDVRVHALSGALCSAVAIRRHGEATRYLNELDETFPLVTDAYTRADVGIEIADSLHRLGDTSTARTRLATATALASTHAFYEVIHRGERVAASWERVSHVVEESPGNTRRRRFRRSDEFRMVLRSLSGLAASTS